jgi:xanthine dehydrogenase accessory factor
MTATVLRWALDCLEQGNPVVIATVIEVSGSVPGKVGARIAMTDSGDEWIGTVGGAGLEMNVLDRCRELIMLHSKPFGEVLTFGLNKSAKGYEVKPLDSLCGGRVTLSIEVMIPMPHILMMGGGHCGQALAEIIDSLGWSFSVHDTRFEYCNDSIFPNAKNLYFQPVSQLLDSMNEKELSKYSDILLLGHDWGEDQQRLLGLLSKCNQLNLILDGNKAPRIGVIGSRSKWKAFQKECLKQGISQDMLDTVICPIGLNIGAESPEEIAIAVVAQIMSFFKNVDSDKPSWRDA